MKDALKPDAARLIRESLEMTRGVRVTDVISVHSASSALAHMGMVQIKLIGWTPTLHAYEYTWQEDFGIPLSAEHQCEEILLAVQQFNGVNILAEIEAGKLGLTDPVDHRSPEGIDHMLVDRSVVALLSRGGGDPKAVLRSLVAELIEMPGLDGMGGILNGDNGHTVGIRILPSVSLGEMAEYNGAWLHTDQRLPETLIEAVVGRPLGAVADVPAEIADRPIIKASNEPRGAQFDVWPEFVSVRDI